MPEKGRWCEDAEKVMIFFLDDLASIGPGHNYQRAMWTPEAQKFDTPALVHSKKGCHKSFISANIFLICLIRSDSH